MLVIGSEAQALGVTPVDGPGRDYVRTYVGTYVHTGEVAVRPPCLWEKERCGPPTARCASTYVRTPRGLVERKGRRHETSSSWIRVLRSFGQRLGRSGRRHRSRSSLVTYSHGAHTHGDRNVRMRSYAGVSGRKEERNGHRYVRCTRSSI